MNFKISLYGNKVHQENVRISHTNDGTGFVPIEQ